MNASDLQKGIIGRAAVLLLAWAFTATLLPLPAAAADRQIHNTARVDFTTADGTHTLASNTVVTNVLRVPPVSTRAGLQFRRYDPTAEDSIDLPVEGGQCLLPSGDFGPLPAALDGGGNPLGAGAITTGAAPGYYIGDPVVLTVTDPVGNADPTKREFVEVQLTASTGDAETLRLHETGVDTGIFAGAIQSVLVPPAATPNDCVLSLVARADITASYADADYPLEALVAASVGFAPLPTGRVALRLEHRASKETVEIGDFLQYTFALRNISDGPVFAANISDALPPGLRFRPGSLRVSRSGPVDPAAARASGLGPAAGGATPMASGEFVAVSDPEIAADGRSLVFPVGDLAPDAEARATLIAEVGPGARGPTLLNVAIGSAAGSITSNEADSMVRMADSLATSAFTIVGRVLDAASCEVPVAERKGVPGVRVLLDDGTYVTTDKDGAYHFEGVRPGTHVAQLDLVTLPSHLEPAACASNTRHAGRAYSQFVEAQGGMLARADFFVAPRAGAASTVGSRLQVAAGDGGLQFTVDLDGGEVPVSGLVAMLALPDGSQPVPGSVRLDGAPGPEPEMTGSIAVFRLADPGANWRHRLEFQARPPSTCPDGGYANKLVVLFEAGGKPGQRTPPAEAVLPCPPDPARADSGRSEIAFHAAVQTTAASPFAAQEEVRRAIPDAVTASGGGEVDWFAGQLPGHAIVFPAKDYNPRSPATRVVVKHLPTERATLSINGAPPSVVNVDGTRKSADGRMAVTMWRGLPLREGNNEIVVDIRDASGTAVATLRHEVYYAGFAARAELVPEQSVLVADGMHNPVLAIRLRDHRGHPVRDGLVGEFSLSAPYLPARTVEQLQEQQFVARSAGPTWRVEGDDGIAYIGLEPTSVAGMAKLEFSFDSGTVPGAKTHEVRQEIEAWLKSAPRDWVVVGFAKGSVGYDTLADNMQALPADEDGSGLRGDGQVSLYAKGRVMGKWLLTMAYDSDKPTELLRGRSLLSTIDPGQYYTLYGDGSQQGYDAASARKLYLKLERDQFYALFGDFQSGLDRNVLSRYQRTLNGVKVEYRGPLVEFTGFAAETAQSYMRDEIQGDGTSGLYRLRHRELVLNSERVRIETRDRYHSEQIIESRDLVRHIDYDIDYGNGTLFFREPIASRDFDFNPNWIVVEYETRGIGEKYRNGGGRVGIRAMDNRLEAGATYLHDEDRDGRSQLAGVDAKFRLTERDELRAEVATTRGETTEGDTSGSAWLFEWQHRGERYDLLAYARRSGPGFGLGQQNAVESGMAKAGVQGQWRIGPGFSLQGEAYRLEDLSNGATRESARAELAYRGTDWTAKAGLQWAHDRGRDGSEAESQQVTLGASKAFLDRRLELGVQGEFAVGGKNESVDFPTRLQLNAAYAITDGFRILAAQEFTDGKDRDTSTTRFGFEAKPWKDATLSTTLNQSEISEYGPRTFALFGLNQKFMLNARWSFDVAVDSSHAFNESGETPLVVDPSQPIQVGGIRDGGALTEDFVALSGGATYHSDLWMWNARLEGRQGDDNERYGFTTAFLRQIRDGVAMSASAQAFSQHNADGSTGLLANAQLSWAYRPLGGSWSMLDKLEFRLDELNTSQDAVGGDMRSSRIINNFVLNYGSGAWEAEDGAGGVLDLYQRSQLSLYYGSRYVLDSFDGDDYSGYSDILGAEMRFDLSPKVDIGFRASVLHSWSQDSFAWAFGPSVGFTPFANAWVSVGYNVRGFDDRDFQASHYTAEGAYLVFRVKFDQGTFGLDKAAPRSGLGD